MIAAFFEDLEHIGIFLAAVGGLYISWRTARKLNGKGKNGPSSRA